MPRAVFECPRCHRSMEEGFLLDRARNWNGRTEWVEGAPERSIWMGLKLRGRRRMPVVSYRCAGCGFLESYAREA